MVGPAQQLSLSSTPPPAPSAGSAATHGHTALPVLGFPPVVPKPTEGSAGTGSRSKRPCRTFSPFPGMRVLFLELAAARPLDALVPPVLRLKVMACHGSLTGSATRHLAPMIYMHFLGGHPSPGSRGRKPFARAGATPSAQLLGTSTPPGREGTLEPGPQLLTSAWSWWPPPTSSRPVRALPALSLAWATSAFSLPRNELPLRPGREGRALGYGRPVLLQGSRGWVRPPQSEKGDRAGMHVWVGL